MISLKWYRHNLSVCHKRESLKQGAMAFRNGYHYQELLRKVSGPVMPLIAFLKVADLSY